MTVIEIIELLGGPLEVAMLCNIHQTTVQLWEKNGIPEKCNYWGIIIKASKGKISAEVILKANYFLR